MPAAVPMTAPPSEGLPMSSFANGNGSWPPSSGSVRRSSSVPTRLSGGASGNNQASAAYVAQSSAEASLRTARAENKDSGESEDARTATAAASAATAAAKAATQAANAAAAAAAAAAQSESYARESYARLGGSMEAASLEGAANSFLGNCDSPATLAASAQPAWRAQQQLDSQRSRGVRSPQLSPESARRGQRPRAATPPSGGAVRRHLATPQRSQREANPGGSAQSHWEQDVIGSRGGYASNGAAEREMYSPQSVGSLRSVEGNHVEPRQRGNVYAMRPSNAPSSRAPTVPASGVCSDGGREDALPQAALDMTAPILSTLSAASAGATAELHADQWSSPPRSPFIGVDARYTGRGVALPASNHRPTRGNSAGTSARRTDRLQRDLDVVSAEMRRVQQAALLAAQ